MYAYQWYMLLYSRYRCIESKEVNKTDDTEYNRFRLQERREYWLDYTIGVSKIYSNVKGVKNNLSSFVTYPKVLDLGKYQYKGFIFL